MKENKSQHRIGIWWTILIWVVVVSLLLTACGGVGGPKTVKVAVNLPLGYDFCQDMLNAAQLALDEADGKAGNITVEMVVFDTFDYEAGENSEDLNLEKTTEAAKDPTIVAYLGPPFSGNAKTILPILNEAGLAAISSLATWPGLTKPGYGPGEPGIYYPTGRRHFFRTVPSDDVQGAAAARWARDLGFKTAYILNDNDSYAVGVAGIFEVTTADVGIEVVGHEIFGEEGVPLEEIATLAERVTAAQPDVVYLGGAAGWGGETVVEALHQADPDLPIIGPDAMVHDELISLVGADLAEGVYGTTVGIPADKLDTPGAAAFAKNYQAAYGKAPSPPDLTTYEAMKVLLYAIEHAKEPTREGVLEAMQNLGQYSGTLGDWHFDERGDISMTAISGMQVQKGAWAFVQIVE